MITGTFEITGISYFPAYRKMIVHFQIWTGEQYYSSTKSFYLNNSMDKFDFAQLVKKLSVKRSDIKFKE